MMGRAFTPLVWPVGLAVLLSPFFFTLYRLAVFNTVPHDDYSGFLLWLDGNAAGGIPESPYCYRLLSMVAAWPLFKLMPLLPITNLPEGMTAITARAIGALAMLSYLCGIGQALLVFRLGRREGGLDRAHAMLAAVLAWVLTWYTQVTAIDGLALLMITWGLCVVRQPLWFALVIALSIGVNEKIALVLALWLAARWVLGGGERLRWQFAIAWAGVELYFTLVWALHRPGNEYQLHPGGFMVTIMENIAAYGSLRGLMLNVLPTVMLAAVAGLGVGRVGVFARRDAWVIPGLVAVALVVTHLFQAGRIVMHAAPIFVVPAMVALQHWGRRADGVATAI